MYKVDRGSKWEYVGTKAGLLGIYEREIDHTEYPDFDGWLMDMYKMDLVREVK